MFLMNTGGCLWSSYGCVTQTTPSTHTLSALVQLTATDLKCESFCWPWIAGGSTQTFVWLSFSTKIGGDHFKDPYCVTEMCFLKQNSIWFRSWLFAYWVLNHNSFLWKKIKCYVPQNNKSTLVAIIRTKF